MRNIHDVIFFCGTDCASVMTGGGKGVYGRMKEMSPHLINVHCMARCLALCTWQTVNSIPMVKKCQEWLTMIFYNFKKFTVLEKVLHKLQSLLGQPTIKYRVIHSVRCLSFFKALQSVYRTSDPLMTYLHNCNASRDPKAKRLLRCMASRQFLFYSLHYDGYHSNCLQTESCTSKWQLKYTQSKGKRILYLKKECCKALHCGF
jgi:hypothetical protein